MKREDQSRKLRTPSLWENLPKEYKLTNSLNIFKRKLKTVNANFSKRSRFYLTLFICLLIYLFPYLLVCLFFCLDFVFVFTACFNVVWIFNYGLNPLSPNPTQWSNTLKQFVGNLPTNCLSVLDRFVKLVLKGLSCAYEQINN